MGDMGQGRGKYNAYTPHMLGQRSLMGCHFPHTYSRYFEGINVCAFHGLGILPRTFITANLISHACMLQKGAIPRKLKLNPFLKAYPRKFISLIGAFSDRHSMQVVNLSV